MVLTKSQVLQEISQKKAFAEQQLLIVRQQKTARTREARMLALTASEVSSLPAQTRVYEGVGKMYVPYLSLLPYFPYSTHSYPSTLPSPFLLDGPEAGPHAKAAVVRVHVREEFVDADTGSY
tara:strand:- start:3685 stop:4050 length:366 start_codon:yes stop_codon:yes gene_type:complete